MYLYMYMCAKDVLLASIFYTHTYTHTQLVRYPQEYTCDLYGNTTQ